MSSFAIIISATFCDDFQNNTHNRRYGWVESISSVVRISVLDFGNHRVTPLLHKSQSAPQDRCALREARFRISCFHSFGGRYTLACVILLVGHFRNTLQINSGQPIQSSIILRSRSEKSERISAKRGVNIPAYLTSPFFIRAATQLLPQVIAMASVHCDTSERPRSKPRGHFPALYTFPFLSTP